MTADAVRATARRRSDNDVADRAAAIGARLDFETVAQEIVDAVIDVTDFKVATITVREGDRCRRLATAGLPDGRIGMTTPFELWSVLLNPEWLTGSSCYLVPPEAPAQWADIPELAPSDAPNAWTADHGLVVPLVDYESAVVGFIAVDEPRSGLLPDTATIERLEAFAGQAESAFVNARLYAAARRQTDTMTQLFEVAKAMATTSDLDEIIPHIITAMTNRFDRALVVTVGRIIGDEIEVRMRVPAIGDEIETRSVLLTGAVAALHDELRAAGVLLINDLAERTELDSWLSKGSKALLAAGVEDEDRRTIALSVSADRTGAFDAEDVQFIRGLLDITIVAMRNADLYEEVRFAAERDPLTGLRNRRMFWTTVESMLARAHPEWPVSLAVVDVDDFKALNDHHGHDAGDRALRHVAMRLEAGVRETDAVFRIGGEEFVLVMPGTTTDGALAALNRIRGSIGRSRLDLPDVSVSAGLAVASSPNVTGDDLFAAADAALFRAKRAGKNRVELAES